LFSAFNEFVLCHDDHGPRAYPGSRETEFNAIDYWVDLARLLERGRSNLLFLQCVPENSRPISTIPRLQAKRRRRADTSSIRNYVPFAPR